MEEGGREGGRRREGGREGREREYLVTSSEDLEFLLEFGGFLGLLGHQLPIGLQPLLQAFQTILGAGGREGRGKEGELEGHICIGEVLREAYTIGMYVHVHVYAIDTFSFVEFL